MAVKQLVGVFLMGIVVLAEDKVQKTLVGIDDRQGIDLVLPDQIVGLLERRVLAGVGQGFKRRHERGHGRGQFHAGDAVVTAGDDPEKLALGGAVVGDGDGRMPRALFQSEYVGKRRIGAKIRVALDKAGLIGFDATDHIALRLDGLRAVDKRNAAFPRKRDRHFVIGDGLHDRGGHRDVQRNGGFFAALEFGQGRFERDIFGFAVFVGVTRHQQKLAESSGRFGNNHGHMMFFFLSGFLFFYLFFQKTIFFKTIYMYENLVKLYQMTKYVKI